MALTINNNMMAATATRNLNNSYNALSKSVNRLSSGLRINSAADDAAGLAIRELMRSDIASLNQGVRNANDAISLIQTADGALGVIDEKLIRMKELATQASTGTYTSTQRLIIDSEYQAMASEITRIANATDFNGLKLLDGSLSSSSHDGSGLEATGKLKVHFGTGNESAEDYYYIQIADATAQSLGVGNSTSYENLMKRAEDSAMNALSKDFAALKSGTPEEQAAFKRMEDATKKMFSDLDTRMEAIFSPAAGSGQTAAANFSELFSTVDVAGIVTANPTDTGDQITGKMFREINKTRVYSSQEELDKAAESLYDSISKEAILGGSATGAFSGADSNICAMAMVGALYDNAIVVPKGASVPQNMDIDKFNSLPPSEKEALKASVAMAYLNTMTSGSTVQNGSIAGMGTGAANSALGQLNNMNPDGTKNTTGTAVTGVKLTSDQFKNVVGKFQSGFNVATSSGKGADGAYLGNEAQLISKATVQAYQAAVGAGTVTAGTAAANGLPAGGAAGGTGTSLLKGVTQALREVTGAAVGGYTAGNAVAATSATPLNDLYGAVTAPNAAFNTGIGRATPLPLKSLQNAYAKSVAQNFGDTARLSTLDGNNIQTQESAQKALGALTKAIEKKDNIRADLGAMQNRLENTISNLEIQAENLQASESRISDVDVATEMTQFVRNQILTQSAVAMLSQANSMPRMAMQLIGG